MQSDNKNFLVWVWCYYLFMFITWNHKRKLKNEVHVYPKDNLSLVYLYCLNSKIFIINYTWKNREFHRWLKSKLHNWTYESKQIIFSISLRVHWHLEKLFAGRLGAKSQPIETLLRLDGCGCRGFSLLYGIINN